MTWEMCRRHFLTTCQKVEFATRAVFTASLQKLSLSICEYYLTPDQILTTSGYSPWLGLWEEGNVCGTGYLVWDGCGVTCDQHGLFFVLQCVVKGGLSCHIIQLLVIDSFWVVYVYAGSELSSVEGI